MKENVSWGFKTLLILLLAASFSIYSQAQETRSGIQINEVMKLCDQSFGEPITGELPDCPLGTVAANLEDGCPTGTITLSAFCVDLVENPVLGNSYLWPTELPPVYISYQYQQSQFGYTPQITEWTYFADHVSGHQVFQGSVEISLDVLNSSGICGSLLDPNPGQFEFDIYVEIVTLVNAPFPFYSLYPINDLLYATNEGIFSCEVFEENCHICTPDNADPCWIPGPPTYDLTVCVNCNDCDNGSGDLPPPNTDDKDIRLAGSATQNASLLSVSPNPFSASIRYEYVSNTETDVVVRLFTLTGQEVIREVKTVGVGTNTFLLNTETLIQGVYYLQVGEDSNGAKRLIKME